MQLAVLQVEFDLTVREPVVVATMSSYLGTQSDQIWQQRLLPAQFGLDVPVPIELHVPADLRTAIGAVDLAGQSALWLRLVAPYGHLGAVPWERELMPIVDVPVLRAPNQLPTTPVLGRTWTIAVVDAAPASSWAGNYVIGLIRSLLAVMPGEVTVDVFADSSTAADLRTRPMSGPVRLHRPAEARPTATSRSANLPEWTHEIDPRPPTERVWAEWIANGMGGQAPQLLILIADGGFDGQEPVLLVSSDPHRPAARSKAALVSTADIARFCEVVGATTVCLVSPPHGRNDLAVRQFADAIGQQRAGATVYSGVELDGDGRALARAVAFLRDPSAVSAVPHDLSLFAYVQPGQIQTPGQTSTTGVSDRYKTASTVPSWVVSADRYLTNQRAALDDGPNETAYDQGVASALDDLTAIIHKHASGP